MIWIILICALYINCVSCGTEYTLDLTLIEPYASEPSDVYLGKKLVYDATATFLDGETTDGVVIEIIVSITAPTVFAIGEIISYTEGSMLSTPDTTIDSSNFKSFITRYKGSDYENTELKQRFDNRAVVTIGEVISSGSTGNDADNQITIRFEAVYISLGSLTEDSEHPIGIGMEYANGSYIWIATDKKNLKDGPGTGSSETTDPTFELTGDDTNIPFMTPKLVEVTMYIPRSASPLKFEAVVMNETAGVFVQEVNLTSVGEAYAFATVKENIVVVGYGTCPLSTSLSLDFGTMINKESKEASPDNSSYALTVGTYFIVDNRDLVGSTVNVGFGLDIGGNEVWITEIDLDVIPGSEPDFTLFTTAVVPGDDIVSPGFAGGVEVVLTIPRGSNHEYTFDLSTKAAAPSTNNALSILAITPTTHGNNIPCDIAQSAVNVILGETVSGSGLYETASLVVNISNPGMQPQPDGDSDLYTFLVYVMMMTDASEGELYQLGINVRDVGIQYVEFTGGPAANYTDVTYSFTLDNDCGSSAHLAGSTLTFKMTVETERNATAGNMTIEAPIPSNVSANNAIFKSAIVTSKGLNVVCLPLGQLTPELIGSGETERASLTIPLMCNREIKDDKEEDKFVVEVKVTLKDVSAILDADTTDQEEFGIGVKIHTKIWVACYGFNTKGPIITANTKRIDGVTIPDGTNMTGGTWPGDLKVQWSDDNLNYHDYSYSFGVGTPGTGVTTYALEPPLYARYARMISTDKDTCIDYSFETSEIGDDITFLGAASSSEILSSKVMFLLDNDPSTCMTLPTPDSSDTAQYYWGNFNTPVLGAQGNESFNLHVTGNGLECNNGAGPQITMALFPDNSDTLKFKGRRRKCSLLDEIPGTPKTCKYECACSDTVTCADILLVLNYNGSPTGPYELCDIKVVQ